MYLGNRNVAIFLGALAVVQVALGVVCFDLTRETITVTEVLAVGGYAGYIAQRSDAFRMRDNGQGQFVSTCCMSSFQS